MDRDRFLAHRAERWTAALAAADAVLAGDPTPAAQLLAVWRLEKVPGALDAVLRVAVQVDTPADAVAIAGCGALAPHPPQPGFAYAHHRTHARLPEGTCSPPPTPQQALAFVLDELRFQGEEVDLLDGAVWGDGSPARPHPDDPLVRALWDAWVKQRPGRFWSLWSGPLGGAPTEPPPLGTMAWDLIRKVALQPDVPAEVKAWFRRHDGTPEQRWANPFALYIHGGADGVVGWQELAAYTLEYTGGPGLVALAQELDPAGVTDVAVCSTSRGTRQAAIRQLWPDVPCTKKRTVRLRHVLKGRPDTLEALVNYHTCMRLLTTWTDAPKRCLDPKRTHGVVWQNRGRARARLRAVVLRQPPERWVLALAARPGIARHTRAATRSLADAWAWRQTRLAGFSYEPRPVTRRCADLPHTHLPRFITHDEPARTWVWLCVIRGQLSILRTWSRTGTLERKNGPWQRCLNAAPDCVCQDRPGQAPKERYYPLQFFLDEALEELLHDLLPALEALARLPARRAKASHIRPLLDEFGWDARVAKPKGAYNRIPAHCEAALQHLPLPAIGETL